MTTALPAEQDALLKELNDIDAQERAGILPERSNINLFLIVLIWAFGTFLAILTIVRQQNDLLYQILALCLLVSFALMGAFYNKKWGFYLSCIIALAINLYVTYQYKNQYGGFLTLVDGLTIFIFSNQLGKRGYIGSATLMVAKMVVLYLFFADVKNIEDIVSNIITIVIVGVIPVLLASISRASRRAKKQEIRAEILSLQNQDLIKSWGDFYQSGMTSGTPAA
jgi:membrane-associated HD superfamily phosphohydrolase